MILLCWMCAILANAADPAYRFVLTADGQSEKQVQNGDVVTVYCVLEKEADANAANVIYAFQNEIEYDRSFLTILEDSYMLSNPAVVVQDVQRNARIHELYVNYLSMSAGTEWPQTAKLCIFQVQITGENGVGRLHCQDYSVSIQNTISASVTTNDLLLVINEACIIEFDTTGGSAVASQTVTRYEKATKPADPTRSGYRFTGWFTDEDCTEPWQYDEPVLYNNILYAGWEAEDNDKMLPYIDVQPKDWFYEGVAYATEQRLMNGISQTTFDPNGETSRAMLVTILWRVAGRPQVDYAMTFADVAQDQWYTEAIRWASGMGIVQGYSQTEFGLNDPVTREQMAVILYRYSQTNGTQTEQEVVSAYQDAEQISPWARDGLNWAVATELLQGVGNGMLSPGGQASRAQTATIFMRFCQRMIW